MLEEHQLHLACTLLSKYRPASFPFSYIPSNQHFASTEHSEEHQLIWLVNLVGKFQRVTKTNNVQPQIVDIATHSPHGRCCPRVVLKAPQRLMPELYILQVCK